MRYIIGIDLGTTNSSVAYIDTEDVKASVISFKIPQLIAEGFVESLSTLPSCCYLTAAHEWTSESVKLPWQSNLDFFIGKFAQQQGAKVPTRLVQSAKSWLCHSAANRKDKILPLESTDENLKISPVEATTRYLRHIREAWNETIAKGDLKAEFEAQEIILTVPASFDEVARALTVEAAKMAGFVQMTLLEEPQAAFYSWIAQHETNWQTKLNEGISILVCDVGGGTTDFSLIEVIKKNEQLTFQRMAVGDHLLLGGDNMDAAVSHLIEMKLSEKGHELNKLQRLQLHHEARKAKEALLRNEKDHEKTDSYRVLLQGIGSGVVKNTIGIEISKLEIQEFLLDGFFGKYTWNDAIKLQRSVGIRTMGLPYESEPSITKHLAYFLSKSGQEGPRKPDFILFNGGAMKPALFQNALIDSLDNWFPEKKVQVLPSFNLDLAVARGAAYYGKARQGSGIKIGGGVARGYYLILDIKNQQGEFIRKALTLLPRGSEEGSCFEPANTFTMNSNTPVSFQLGTSHTRLYDKSGDLIAIDHEEMHLLPPIQTILRFGKKQGGEGVLIPVHLHIELTPIGTLELNLKSQNTEHTWALEFQIRSVSGQDNSLMTLEKREADETFDAHYLKESEVIISNIFEKRKIKPEKLMEELEQTLSTSRKDWPPSVMRGLADSLLKMAVHRKLSTEYAIRWWNSIGFLMRPGFGYALDDYRIKELWKVILNDFKSTLPLELQIQLWICYRRIAGGLNKGQQMQLAVDLLGTLINKKNGKIEVKSKSELYSYSEKVRAIASLELIDNTLKSKLGNALIQRILTGEGILADFWALGRLGSRHLFYGSIANVFPKEECQKWIEKLLAAKNFSEEHMAFLFGQLARKTEYKELNLSNQSIEKILEKFNHSTHLERLQELLLKENQLTQVEQDQIFGERLPAGLILEM